MVEERGSAFTTFVKTLNGKTTMLDVEKSDTVDNNIGKMQVKNGHHSGPPAIDFRRIAAQRWEDDLRLQRHPRVHVACEWETQKRSRNGRGGDRERLHHDVRTVTASADGACRRTGDHS